MLKWTHQPAGNRLTGDRYAATAPDGAQLEIRPRGLPDNPQSWVVWHQIAGSIYTQVAEGITPEHAKEAAGIWAQAYRQALEAAGKETN